jgi:hypothetical protein
VRLDDPVGPGERRRSDQGDDQQAQERDGEETPEGASVRPPGSDGCGAAQKRTSGALRASPSVSKYGSVWNRKIVATMFDGTVCTELL